jgi:hypothetical protein
MRPVRAIAWCIIAIFAVLLVVFHSYSYSSFLALVIKITGYNKPDKIALLLTEGKFKALKLSPALGVVVGVLALIFRWQLGRALSRLKQYTILSFHSIKLSVRSFSQQEVILISILLLINVCVKVYFAITLPISYDEAWTFLNFTTKGIASSISYYPAPNNHIFFSVLTNLFSHLPLSYQLMLRLPALLGNCLFIFLLYTFTRRLYSYKVALTLATISSFLFPVLYYGFMARGYSYVLLFFLISYYAVIKLFINPAQASRYLFVFSVSAVFGFYTVPAFLYPYGTIILYLGAWAIIKEQNVLLRKIILWCMFTTFCVIILYTPIFIVSGIKSVTSNNFVLPISRTTVLHNLADHFMLTYSLFFYFPFALPSVIVLLLLAFINKQYRIISVFNLWIIVFAFAIPVIHSVLPFPRIWIYLEVPVIFSAGSLLQYAFSPRLPMGVLISFLLIFMVAECVQNTRLVYQEENYAVEAKQMCGYLLANKVKIVYTNEALTDVFVIYTYKELNKPVQCFMHPSDIADTANKMDALILKKDTKDIAPGYYPMYNNDYVIVYRKKMIK